MKWNRLFYLALVFGIIQIPVFSQTEPVKGTVSTSDTARISILRVFPDSFPNVAVVFRAEKKSGEPVWNLTREMMQVKENKQDCEVVSLHKIADSKAVNIGIVFDHSGSMAVDEADFYAADGTALFTIDSLGMPVMPPGYKSPLANAQNAVKEFTASFNAQKDYISLIGFSSAVDIRQPLTHDMSQINKLVDGMKPDFSTAFYDALLEGIQQVKGAVGVNVIVAMTDGRDNSSHVSWEQVVEKANKEKIPLYIIGFGGANKDTLQLIASKTNGQFYFASSSASLKQIYALISKQVQAFYEMVYTSANLKSTDTDREIALTFETDSMYIESSPLVVNLPHEVVHYLERKEKEKQYLIYGGIGLLVVVAAGTLFYRFRKKKSIPTDQPLIIKLYPNPTAGIITLEYRSGPGILQITGMDGKTGQSIPLSGPENQFDLSALVNGTYVAVIHSEGKQSNPVQFIIQH